MNLFVSDEQLIGLCVDNSTFFKGYNYFTNNKVTDINFYQNAQVIDGIVNDGTPNHVKIYYNSNEIPDYACDCALFASTGRMCEHIVALIKKYQSQPEIKSTSTQKQQQYYQNICSDILDELSDVRILKPRQLISVMPVLRISKHKQYCKITLTLKVGIDRLYVVKDIFAFLDTLESGEQLSFGKHFVFDDQIHIIPDSVKPLIDTLKFVHQMYVQQGISISDKELPLEGIILIKILRILSTIDYEIYINNILKDHIRIYDRSAPLGVSIAKQDDGYVLDFFDWCDIDNLTQNYSTVMWKENIYILPPSQAKILNSFTKAYRSTGEKFLKFDNEYKSLLITNVLPKLRSMGKLKIDNGIKQDVIFGDLNLKIYFDVVSEFGISARVFFCYNDIEFNHFASEEPKTKGKVLIRDKKAENNFIRYAAQCGFYPEKGMLYITDEAKLYIFLSEEIHELSKNAQVYYSDAFTNMKVISPKRGMGVVNISGGNTLELNINFDEINKDELSKMLSSIIEKKKYHRLQNGSFINLGSENIKKFISVINNLDISAKSIQQNKIQVPISRSFFLNAASKEGYFDVSGDELFKSFIAKFENPENLSYELPEQLQHVMRGYQIAGFKWMKTLATYNLGGILADEMGLGKTLQAIAFIVSEYEKNHIPSLVIAPTSLVFNWQAEFLKFVPNVKTKVIYGDPFERTRELSDLSDTQVIITSYGLLRRDIHLYTQHTFNYCIIDEAQHIKNPHTINARSVKSIKAKGFFALTGTPVENNLTEIWSIFDFVMPGYLYTKYKFRRMYEVPILKNNDSKSLSSLLVHTKPFVLRRLKSQVLKELPDKIESYMVSEFTGEQRKIYHAFASKAKEDILQLATDKGFQKSRIEILAIITRLRQICCHPSLFIENYSGGSGKLDMLLELVENSLSCGRRILIFSQFTSMLSIIKKALDEININYFYLDGKVKSHERIEMVDAFNSGINDIFLISLKAGGAGLNLTGADMVIHYDPWWNPAVENQATDRAHRIGQTKVVQVVKMISKGSIEENICKLKEQKQQMIDSVVETGETLLAAMNFEEIKSLFE